MRVIAYGLVAIGIALAIYVSGVQVGKEHSVCHSATEDSFPYDCNYSNHSWTRK